MIEIFTDGACLGNPGRGGWAAIVRQDGRERELQGHEPRTTNNRMEMMAVIKGLAAAPAGASVTVYSDSQYVINTMTKNWKRRKNLDLWAALDREKAARQVTWKWIKGHAGHPLNERADKLATERAKLGETVGGGSRPTRMDDEGTTRKTDSLATQQTRLDEPAPGGSHLTHVDDEGTTRKSDSLATQQTRLDEPAPGGSHLTHVDDEGKASMVDVGAKAATQRLAVARGAVVMQPETLRLVGENAIEKGDVLGVARIAGIMAAKKTAELIPLCHPLPLDKVSVDLRIDEAQSAVEIEATAATTAKTGVEMEALTAVSVAALTVYDMVKAVDRGTTIQSVRLVRKTGGASGDVELE